MAKQIEGITATHQRSVYQEGNSDPRRTTVFVRYDDDTVWLSAAVDTDYRGRTLNMWITRQALLSMAEELQSNQTTKLEVDLAAERQKSEILADKLLEIKHTFTDLEIYHALEEAEQRYVARWTEEQAEKRRLQQEGEIEETE